MTSDLSKPETAQLLPCPLCGGKADFNKGGNEVRCLECKIRVETLLTANHSQEVKAETRNCSLCMDDVCEGEQCPNFDDPNCILGGPWR